MAKKKTKRTAKKKTLTLAQFKKVKLGELKNVTNYRDQKDFNLDKALSKASNEAHRQYKVTRSKQSELKTVGKYLDKEGLQHFKKWSKNPNKKFLSQLMKDAEVKYKHHYINYKKVSKAEFKRQALLMQQWLLKTFGRSLIQWKYWKTIDGKININIPNKKP